VRKTINIREILVHAACHWDEIVAITLARLYGRETFPGIETAPIKFTEGVERHADQFFDAAEILPFGVGGGRFDEHGLEGRNEDECCATLVAKYLGIDENPGLRDLLAATLRLDTKPNAAMTDIAEVIKMANRQLRCAPNVVIKWAELGLNAIIRFQAIRYDAVPEEKRLSTLFEEYVRNKRTDGRIAETIRAWIAKSEASATQSVTDLTFVVKALQRTGTSREDVVEWTHFVFNNYTADQALFWEAVELLKNQKVHMVDFLGRKGKQKIRVLMVESDNPLCQKASRMRDIHADVFIRRNSKGQVQVFTSMLVQNLNLANFARMIRWLELPKDEHGRPKTDISWKELGAQDTLSTVPEWYLFKGMLLNGSHSHPGVPATRIASKAILEVAYHAFHPGQTSIWMAMRGIGKEPELAVQALFKDAETPNPVIK